MATVNLDLKAVAGADAAEITRLVRQGAVETSPQSFAVSRGRPGYDLTPMRDPGALAAKLLELAQKGVAGDHKAAEAARALVSGNRQAFKYVLARFRR
jgi:hypothetical protein